MSAERSVLIVTYELPETRPGGIATVAAQKIALFSRAGWKVRVVGPAARGWGNGGGNHRARPASVAAASDFHAIRPRGNLRKLAQTLAGLFRLVRAERPDLIYSVSGTYAALASCIAARRFDLPYVVMAHGNEFIRFARTPVLKGVLRRIYNGALFVSAVSRFTAARLEDIGVAKKMVFVCHNGVDTERFRVPPPEAVSETRARLAGGRSFVLVTVARLDSRKNHLAVLAALEELRARRPGMASSLRYVIGGVGPMERAIQERVAASGLEDIVRMVGLVPDEDLPTYYAAADAFVMPALYERDKGSVEGFGLVFLEAAACGVTCIAGREGGVPDAVVDQENGLLVDGRRSVEVATAIERLFDDTAERERLARMARKRATSRFDMREVFRRELDHLEAALAVRDGMR